MYIDLLKSHLNIKTEEQIITKTQKENTTRFCAIYKGEEDSSSSSDEEQSLGSKKLSNRKSQKLLNYLIVEINMSR